MLNCRQQTCHKPYFSFFCRYFEAEIQYMTRFIYSALAIILLINNASAQMIPPAEWSHSFSKKEIMVGDFVELVFTAPVPEPYYVYSNDFVCEFGAEPASFAFEDNGTYQLVGKPIPLNPKKKFDDIFQCDISIFKKKAEFRQKLRVLKENFSISGAMHYQMCSDEACVQHDYEFEQATLLVKPLQASMGIDQDPAATKPAEASSSNLPVDTALTKPTDTTTNHAGGAVKKDDGTSAQGSATGEKEDKKSGLSIWRIFILGFLGGFAALLTPCVFPIIPLTVSFFTKKSKSRAEGISNGILYGVSIIVIYVALGYLVTAIFGADTLNQMSSNVWFNLFFFVLLIIFGISFLGAFEITLPSSWANKLDATAEKKGGILGIFLMAFVLSLVSFSCTGPIIGTLLVQAAVSGEVLGPVMGMFGFALALALPFGLFAAFPGWLNTLPRSGGWLNSVKVVLGLLEIAFALKFLSNVDLAYHWGILTREVFIAFWISIFSILGLYLIGKIRFSHDSPLEFVSIGRGLMAMVVFAFVIYLIPGMFGAPLKLIGAFPPPDFYTEGWKLGSEKGSETGSLDNTQRAEELAAGIDREHCPLGLPCFHDYESGLAYAKKVNKPVMIDFTGWACVNCRKMENNVWSDPEVYQRLENDFVLISLYVDDKEKLPEGDIYYSEVLKKKINTIGRKWTEMEVARYNRNSQPYYVLLDHNEKELTEGKAYDPSIENFIAFLDAGKEAFTQKK